LNCVPVDAILAAQREEQDAKNLEENKRAEAYKQRGMFYSPDAGLQDEF